MAEINPNGDITIIGSDSHFTGELAFEKAARINGRFDGKINGKGELHINDNAQCKADVEATSVNVDGRIEGNLTARDTVRLNAKGVVKGDIVAAKMLMAEGASFSGQCSVGPDAAKQAGAGGSSSSGGSGGGRPNVPPSAQAGPQGGASGGNKGGEPPKK